MHFHKPLCGSIVFDSHLFGGKYLKAACECFFKLFTRLAQGHLKIECKMYYWFKLIPLFKHQIIVLDRGHLTVQNSEV